MSLEEERAQREADKKLREWHRKLQAAQRAQTAQGRILLEMKTDTGTMKLVSIREDEKLAPDANRSLIIGVTAAFQRIAEISHPNIRRWWHYFGLPLIIGVEPLTIGRD